MKIAVIFNQFGPYHYARLNEAGKRLEVYGIELFSKSKDYQWDATGLDKNIHFVKKTLFKNRASGKFSKNEQKKAIFDALDEISPDAVAINGWSEPGALAALKWCLKRKVPAIAMSDSTEFDVPRARFKEAIKRQVISGFSSAFVAGKPQKRYMQKLGMHEANVFFKYDVVDNEYFFNSSSFVKQDASSLSQRFNLPEKYFLASARFIPKKNLIRLLEAFSLYLSERRQEAWSLVLLGDGELRPSIERLVEDLNIGDKVLLPGFKQYDEIPLYYSLAKAFIHASTSEQWGLVVNEAMACGLPILLSDRCGCAEDLVDNKGNGFLFNPFNTEEIASKMTLISSGACDLNQMSSKSLQVIAEFSTEAFAINLEKAALKAIEAEKKPYSIMNNLTLSLLTQ